MQVQPLISIITVVYNGAKTLEQTIQSVVNQTYEHIEYIIIDGGSTDGTLDIIRKYDDHINFWISEPDRGLYDAMNKGIKIAKGDLIGMINSDDWYETHAVKTVVEKYLKLPENQRKIFHGDLTIHHNENDKKIKKFNSSLFKMLNYGVTYNHPTFFVTRELYKTYLYNSNLKSVADVQFILEILLKEKEAFVYVEKVLANFRKGGVSSQQSILSSLKANYIARQNAGFPTYMNIQSLIISSCYQIFTKKILQLK